MPIVKKISKGHHKDYYRVEIEGEDPLHIHMELILLHNIKEGSAIQLEELKEILQEDLRKRSFNRSLHYLTHKRRTRWEVEEYLKKKGFSQGVIHHTIEKLIHYQMLDDAAYVEAYIAEKLCGEPVGRKKIHYDLARKGIGEELLNRVDDWYSVEHEEKKAMELAQKVSQKYAHLPLRERGLRIRQAGQRKGFSWELMDRVVQGILKGIEEEQDTIAPRVDIERGLQWGLKYKDRYKKRGLEGLALKQRIIQALRGRGYPWDLIEELLPNIIEGADD